MHVNTAESSVYMSLQLQYIRQALLLAALQLLVRVYKRQDAIFPLMHIKLSGQSCSCLYQELN